jgi:hypothetical protein
MNTALKPRSKRETCLALSGVFFFPPSIIPSASCSLGTLLRFGSKGKILGYLS